ncbi:PAS domain S-box protein, partial [bacterium]|nr:PAS domain S-box protein [bacterium]
MNATQMPGWLGVGGIVLGFGLLAGGAVLLRSRRRARLVTAANESRLQRLKAENERLGAELERLTATVEAGRCGVFQLDPDSDSLIATPAFGAIVAGDGPRPGTPDDWLALVHPGDRERLNAARAAGAEPAATGYECEVRLLRADGACRWVLEQGRAVLPNGAGRGSRLVGTVRDITARKRAEQRLEMRGRMAAAFLGSGGDETLESLGALLQDLFEAPCSCVGLLDAEGRLRLACNRADGGTPVLATVAPGSVPAPLRFVLEAEGPLVATDTGDEAGALRAPLLAVRLARRARALGLIAVAGRPGGYRPEDLDMIAAVATDLAPLVQSRLAAETADAQAAQARKLQSLGVMAGGIAHDFNNILQAILGFSALAREDAHDPARLAADLDRVQRATLRGRDLVQRLLHFSRPEDAAAASLDPLPLLEEVARELRASQPPAIRVEVAVAPGCGSARAAPEQLQQALFNLAVNAAQAMGAAGGTLRLSAARENTAIDDPRLPAAWRGRDACVFTVADTGPGIPDEIRARLFDPFFTTRAVGQGTGLGLSVVYGLVTGLGGHVVIECPPAGGTLVSLYLPRGDDAVRGDAPQSAAGAAPVALRGRVLFVDDEPEIRELAVAMLGRAGLEVTTAVDGLDAWEQLGPDLS